MKNNIKHNAAVLAAAYVAALMLPVAVLAYTEKNPLWATVAGILLPLGAYTAFASLARRSGVMVWCGILFIFLSAFQIVLSYLFGNSIIATDMFLNLVTTNPGEANELLSNIYPSVIAVCIVYIPLLWIAAIHIRRRIELSPHVRRSMLRSGCGIMAAGIAVLLLGCRGEIRRVLRDEVFPVNVCYNMGLSISETNKIDRYDQTSAGFTFEARHKPLPDGKREIYVLVIGEASRAANWQLYGYNRGTNPELSQTSGIVLFRNVLTQSNTTHKSVPMILSSIHTSQHEELYRRKGLPQLFNEAGFSTYFISNQSPQGAMIDNLAHDARHVVYIDSPRYDMQMVDCIRKALEDDPSDRLLFILHSYGSHFSYHQRYPRKYAIFQPDDDVAINPRNMDKIRNAYDNSIVYTDHVIAEIIRTLEASGGCSAMFYCSDHGEDLFDKCDARFLHASPTVTYYQLNVASLAWFSPSYEQLFPDKVRAARQNCYAPATSYSVFHTVADMASVTSPYCNEKASLLSPSFDYDAPRYYLNDHNEAVPLDAGIGIDAMQRDNFARMGIMLP